MSSSTTAAPAIATHCNTVFCLCAWSHTCLGSVENQSMSFPSSIPCVCWFLFSVDLIVCTTSFCFVCLLLCLYVLIYISISKTWSIAVATSDLIPVIHYICGGMAVSFLRRRAQTWMAAAMRCVISKTLNSDICCYIAKLSSSSQFTSSRHRQHTATDYTRKLFPKSPTSHEMSTLTNENTIKSQQSRESCFQRALHHMKWALWQTRITLHHKKALYNKQPYTQIKLTQWFRALNLCRLSRQVRRCKFSFHF